MSFKIFTYVNSPLDTNTYCIYIRNSEEAIIIDPGISADDFINDFLIRYKKNKAKIYITHHHFDHVAGLESLKKNNSFRFEVIASKQCASLMIDPKSNLSAYFKFGEFQPPCVDFIATHNRSIFYHGFIKVIPIFTPGHTSGCISYMINKCIFTGDLMIPGLRTITKLPTGNLALARNSIIYLINLSLKYNIKIYPGHGPSFYPRIESINEFLPS
jgi:hydroxyacylglutathione hydrolase